MKHIIDFYCFFQCHAKQLRGGYQRIERVFKRRWEEMQAVDSDDEDEDNFDKEDESRMSDNDDSSD